jgi:ABC-type Fe3+/spermidine/putrescine transport system ATPase subunit
LSIPGGALVLDGVVKRYGAGVTIGPLSLEVRPSEFVALLGPSGCGKTTILRCIAGFETLTEGRILLGGEALHTQPAHRRNVGLVFQSYALFPHLTVFDNVAFGLHLRRLSAGVVKDKVRSVLDLVDLGALESRFPAQLSGGQQQRAAIARAIVLEPPLILFDEPLSNLDQKLREQLRSELRNLQRRLGMTSIFVTHDQSEALALSDRIAVLSQGRIEQVGRPADIYERPASTFVADFIGNANIFDCVSLDDEDGMTHVRLGETSVLKAAWPAPQDGPAKLLVRPEHLRILGSSDAAPGDNLVELTVDEVTYLGGDIHVRGSAHGRSWLIAARSGELTVPLSVGDKFAAAVSPRHVYLLAA